MTRSRRTRPKVTRDDARVDWTLSAAEVGRTIRAYDPKPGAFYDASAAPM